MLRSLPAIAGLVVACLSCVAVAQNYPTRSIRVIVPFPPGGISDALSRILSLGLSQNLGQQVVVDNRPGAGTTLAAELVAKAPADGYTLYFLDVTTHAINATLYRKLPYDSLRDFTPIALVASTPLVLVVHPSVPVRSVKELIGLARARPDELNYASSGNGTILHLSGELFKTTTGTRLTHIPYKGSAPAVTALLAGEASMSFPTTSAALPQIQGGRLRALAVTGDKPSPLLVGVPTMKDTLPGFEILLYSGVMGPPGLPREVVTRLHAEIGKALERPVVKEGWAKNSADAVTGTPEQFGEHLRREIEKLGNVVRASGARVD
jgi:tripartite-type tricarboxylate transporter receptor subunit TctC